MERRIYSAFVALIPTHKIILVSGPKNSGKSAFIEGVFSEKNLAFQKIELGEASIRQEINKLSLAELLWLGNQSDHMLLCECEHLVLLQEFLDEVLNGKVNASIMLTSSNPPKIDEELLEALVYQGAHFYLPPPTFYEYTNETSLPIESKGIDQRLIYGNYYSLSTHKTDKEEGLNQTINNIVSANFSASNRINKSEVLLRTIQVLANHIGQPLSYNQIATFIGVDNETIERYISLLCKSHVLYRLPSYSTEKNFFGPVIYKGIEEIVSLEGVYPHFYGKKETKPFRKMGHVTVLNKSLEEAKKIALKVKETLKVIGNE